MSTNKTCENCGAYSKTYGECRRFLVEGTTSRQVRGKVLGNHTCDSWGQSQGNTFITNIASACTMASNVLFTKIKKSKNYRIYNEHEAGE